MGFRNSDTQNILRQLSISEDKPYAENCRTIFGFPKFGHPNILRQFPINQDQSQLIENCRKIFGFSKFGHPNILQQFSIKDDKSYRKMLKNTLVPNFEHIYPRQ